jgi:hypothetical protein
MTYFTDISNMVKKQNIVSIGQYRDNHIPNRSLSGTIMQIEKYI